VRLTGIETLGDSGTYALHFEDGSRLRCSDRELLEYRLRAGLELTAEAYETLCADCRLFAVKQKAAQLLSQRAMSAGELRQKLLDKGADPGDAEIAVNRLLELHAIDEEAYAAMVVRHYAAKGYGKMRIRQELYRHRLPRDTWEAALDTMPDPDAALMTLIHRKLHGEAADGDTLRKLSAALCRRGYGWQQVREALHRYAQEYSLPEKDEDT